VTKHNLLVKVTKGGVFSQNITKCDPW